MRRNCLKVVRAHRYRKRVVIFGSRLAMGYETTRTRKLAALSGFLSAMGLKSCNGVSLLCGSSCPVCSCMQFTTGRLYD